MNKARIRLLATAIGAIALLVAGFALLAHKPTPEELAAEALDRALLALVDGDADAGAACFHARYEGILGTRENIRRLLPKLLMIYDFRSLKTVERTLTVDGDRAEARMKLLVSIRPTDLARRVHHGMEEYTTDPSQPIEGRASLAMEDGRWKIILLESPDVPDLSGLDDFAAGM